VAECWSDEFAVRVREWCEEMAGLGVDALVDAGLIDKGAFGRALEIVAEELFVRLGLHDYPPLPTPRSKALRRGTRRSR
jgi:hypothetical protein